MEVLSEVLEYLLYSVPPRYMVRSSPVISDQLRWEGLTKLISVDPRRSHRVNFNLKINVFPYEVFCTKQSRETRSVQSSDIHNVHLTQVKSWGNAVCGST